MKFHHHLNLMVIVLAAISAYTCKGDTSGIAENEVIGDVASQIQNLVEAKVKELMDVQLKEFKV